MQSWFKNSLETLDPFTHFARARLEKLGLFTIFLKRIGVWTFRPPFRAKLLFKQLEFVGNKSIPIVALASLFTGAVFGLQIGAIFRIFRAEGMMGAATGKSLALELGPVMCGFIVTGRAGAAMAAEIGTMRVNEQLDAMESMGVDPMSYLIVPRVLASIIMLPMLTAFYDFVGVLGSYIIGRMMFQVDSQIFFQQLQWLVTMTDIRKGMFKAAVFGLIFSSIACFKGFHTKGGAKGVGESTTEAVVIGLLSILISDFFISLVQSR